MQVSKRHWKTLYREQIKIKTCYCYLCGKMIEKEKDFSCDHATPTCRGGVNEPSNWRPAHKKCNSEKGALTYDEWVLWQRLNEKRFGKVK